MDIKKPAHIIDGKKISASILDDLKLKIDQSLKYGKDMPCLAILLIGNNTASEIYISNKMNTAKKVGILTRVYRFNNMVNEKELLEKIFDLNNDTQISGIIVQLPLPKHINTLQIMNAIHPSKDVDGFNPINIGLLYASYNSNFVPCTAMGCLTLIKSCIPSLRGKNITIIGRSNIVGRPLAALLLKEDATITICHSKTKNLSSITSKADIVVAAMGQPKALSKKYFNSNAIVIDVGINYYETSNNKSKIVGDVDFESVKNHVQYITPVPGGVGPMTIAYLLVNTYCAKLKLP